MVSSGERVNGHNDGNELGASGAVATSGEKLRGDREKGERLTVRLTRRPVTA